MGLRIYFEAGTKKIFLVLLCVTVVFGKPVKIDSDDKVYKDTEEIMNEWNNDESSYEYYDDDEPSPAIKHLPPVLVPLEQLPGTTVSTTTTSSTTTRPVYFPNTDIELGPLFEQVGNARRNPNETPVDLPVPYIVWTSDPSGKENTMNYWKMLHNTVYKFE